MELRMVNITKVFSSYDEPEKAFTAVHNVNLQINAGELVTLLGPSGCGKTMLLRMISGFEDPTRKDIFFNAQRMNDVAPNKRNTTLVFQSYAIFPHLDVFENIAFGLRLQKLPEQMRIEIRQLQQRLGITSVYVTHDQVEAMSISDRVVVMNHGCIEQIGTPLELYAHPNSHFVADFIGKADFLPAEVVGERCVRILQQEFEVSQVPPGSAPGASVIIMIRPEAIRLLLSPQDAQTHFQGVIVRTTFLGSIVEYEITVAGLGNLIVHTPNPVVCGVYAKETPVGLHFPAVALHALSSEPAESSTS